MLTTHYYKLIAPNHDWCILSFRCAHLVDVCDRLARSFVRYNIDFHPISFSAFIMHDLSVFATFQIGALQFEVGSSLHLRYLNFFYNNFVSHLSSVNRA